MIYVFVCAVNGRSFGREEASDQLKNDRFDFNYILEFDEMAAVFREWNTKKKKEKSRVSPEYSLWNDPARNASAESTSCRKMQAKCQFPPQCKTKRDNIPGDDHRCVRGFKPSWQIGGKFGISIGNRPRISRFPSETIQSGQQFELLDSLATGNSSASVEIDSYRQRKSHGTSPINVTRQQSQKKWASPPKTRISGIMAIEGMNSSSRPIHFPNQQPILADTNILPAYSPPDSFGNI